LDEDVHRIKNRLMLFTNLHLGNYEVETIETLV